MIKILRLTTGEDVIGKIETKDEKLIHIKQAFVIIPTQSAPGRPVQLMLTPYMPYSADQIIVISSDKVVTMVQPKDEIISAYQQNTSSILTPGNKSLITETKLPILDK